MKKFVFVFLLLMASAWCADAQKSVSTDSDMKAFTALNVSDEFTVTLRKSDDYVLKTNIDERLDPFVVAYVKDGVLYLDIDRKKMTPELKKALRSNHGKAAVIEAEVLVPYLNVMEISGDVVVKSTDGFETDSFRLNASDKSVIENLEMVCRTAELNVSKSASVDLTVSASSLLNLKTSGSSKTFIRQNGDFLTVTSSGTSQIEAVVDVKSLEVNNSGMSNVTVVSGKAGDLKVDASGSSKFKAADVPVPSAYMIQSGSSKSIVWATDTLKVNLVGNSVLEFKENPYIDLEKIVSSTLTRYDGTSSK